MPIPCAVTASRAFESNVGCTMNFIVEFKIEIEQITSMHFNELMTKQRIRLCLLLSAKENTEVVVVFVVVFKVVCTPNVFVSIVGVERELFSKTVTMRKKMIKFTFQINKTLLQ